MDIGRSQGRWRIDHQSGCTERGMGTHALMYAVGWPILTRAWHTYLISSFTAPRPRISTRVRPCYCRGSSHLLVFTCPTSTSPSRAFHAHLSPNNCPSLTRFIELSPVLDNPMLFRLPPDVFSGTTAAS